MKKKIHFTAVKNHVRGFLYSVLLSEPVEGTPVIRTANDEIFPLTESAVWPNPTIPWPRGSTLGRGFSGGVRVGGWGAIRAAEGRAAKGRVVGKVPQAEVVGRWGYTSLRTGLLYNYFSPPNYFTPFIHLSFYIPSIIRTGTEIISIHR